MLEETAYKLHDIQCQCAQPLAKGFLVAKTDTPLLDPDDALVRDGYPKHIGGE